MMRISRSFSLRHSKMVALWLWTTFRSYLDIRLRLKRERYFEFASFTEMNFPNTSATTCFSWGFFGSSSMRHWKHSKSTAEAPFLRLPVTLELRAEWQQMRISVNCFSNPL